MKNNGMNKISKKVLITILAATFSAGLQKASAIEKADILYTGGHPGIPLAWINHLPIGHTAIFVGTKKENGRVVAEMVDSIPNSEKHGGIRKSNWRRFTCNFRYPYYGNRTTSPKPAKEQRDLIVEAALSKVGGKYGVTHLFQKGPKTYDCVGISEYAYESVGLNPTPDKLETGWGWPLTPAEQFANTIANHPGAGVSLIGVPNAEFNVPQSSVMHSITETSGESGIMAPSIIIPQRADQTSNSSPAGME